MEELLRLAKLFCLSEYREESRPLVLYPPDCGGFDVNGEVELKIDKSGIELTFNEYKDGEWKTVTKFNLVVQ